MSLYSLFTRLHLKALGNQLGLQLVAESHGHVTTICDVVCHPHFGKIDLLNGMPHSLNNHHENC